MEIIIAMIIIAVMVTGMSNAFTSARAYILHTRLKMSGGELGRFYLTPLQRDVRQDQWAADTNCLTTAGSITDAAGGVTPTALCAGLAQPWRDPVSDIRYTPEYHIDGIDTDGTVAATGLGSLRRVRVVLRWNEYNPNP